MKNCVEIISAGLYTTIQDVGRFGFSKYGVPKSGAMDQQSFFLANAILNNDKNCAVIEWTMIPPILKFHADTVIVITGAICDPFLNEKSFKMNMQIQVSKGDVLRLKNVVKGVYGFVGIKSGFNTQQVLESRSQYRNISISEFLQKGDQIPCDSSVDFSTSNAVLNISFWDDDMGVIHVFEGPEFCLLSEDQKRLLLSADFSISNTRNRMAIQLDGLLENEIGSILSSPVLPGTVQLTPSGQLIVLMRDCQTTGGYSRILQLSEGAINKIAQKRVGEKVSFQVQS